MTKMERLYDELLLKILTFLPTKDAVSTSILSKRWENLWKSLTEFEYSNRSLSWSTHRNKLLKSFLDSNLSLPAPLESLRLDLDSSFLPESLLFWVFLAVQRGVRTLEISLAGYQRFDSPVVLHRNFYVCKSLVIFKLNGEILMDVPREVYLPSLKTFHLRHVGKFNEDEALQRILSNCPVLEDLLVEINEGANIVGKLTISVPSLQTLSLSLPFNCDIDGFEIRTPSLKFLQITNPSNFQFCLAEHMPNLIEAYIDVQIPDIQNLIGGIRSVKRLTICSQVTYAQSVVFNRLEQLRICRCIPSPEWAGLFFRLLNDSPNLKELESFQMHYYYQTRIPLWTQPSTVPKCLLSSLQTFKCSREERDLQAFILKNAGRLETTTFESDESIEMLKELETSWS